jgi:branched-chain amino acid transport system permease protein
VTRYLALSWGLAGVFGGVVGVTAVPLLGLDPSVFLTVLIYAFSGAVLGGIDNLAGATLGGVILGVVATVLGAYFPVFSSQLNIVPPFIVMLAVLVIRPVGILGQRAATRV